MSLNDMAKALLISFMFFLIFSIIFVSLLKGKFHKCENFEESVSIDFFSN